MMQEQNDFLVTGGTGFVGGAIAASLIDQGNTVYALSRNDIDGERTLKSVESSAEGLGLDPTRVRSHLRILSYDDKVKGSFIKALESIPKKGSIHSVIHAAAEMSYSAKDLKKAMKANKYFTLDFYQGVVEKLTSVRRFYYVSTAYSAGPLENTIKEEILEKPVNVNSYQKSKWATEVGLSRSCEEEGLPVTIFRPSIVVGSIKNGWTGSKPFGFYMYLVGLMRMARRFKNAILHLDLNGENHINLISIDQVNEAIANLIDHEKNQKKLEVVNIVPKNSENNKAKALLKMASSFLRINVKCGPPKSLPERLLNKKVSLNKVFANHDWKFQTLNYKKITGKEIKELSLENLKKVFSFYYHNN